MSRIVVDATKPDRHYWPDLWRFRELMFFLAWRDILVRYKQTAVGIAWALLRPLITIAIGTGVFHHVAGLSSPKVPYVVLVCAGTLPWQFFASCLGESTASLVTNSGLVSKVYFPRLILPTSTMAVAMVDLIIGLAILAVLMAVNAVVPSWPLTALPLFILWAMLAALGPGLILAALNVYYRDFRYVVPFLIQIGLFASPVFYSMSLIQEKWGTLGTHLVSLNPMVGVIEGFRWCIGATALLPTSAMLISMIATITLLAAGLTIFRKMEGRFADVI